MSMRMCVVVNGSCERGCEYVVSVYGSVGWELLELASTTVSA